MVAALGRHIKEGGGWHTGRPPAAARTAVVAASQASPSQGTPSACSPSIITLSHVDSLNELAQAISRSQPRAVEDTNALGQQGTGIQVILEVDLKGRTLAAPDLAMPLLLPTGLKLRLSNGSLHLPEGMCVLVGQGAELEAVRVDFRGSGQERRGIVTVEGEGASAILHQCTITGGRIGRYNGEAHGLLVARGGRAALQNCIVQKATASGIQVKGKGSTAVATSTMVTSCAASGFAAVGGGKLVAERCIAHCNAQYGFLSEDKGVLEAGAGCRSELNEGSGFVARSGQLVAGEGCYAGRNKHQGYYAFGSGGRLHAGAGCIAEHNGGCGFVTSDSAQLLTGPECTAQHNGYAGFATGNQGRLEARPACTAAHNGGVGFLATWHSQLHAARGCNAMHNAEAGFRVQYSAELTVEPGCRAQGNGKSHDDDWVQVPPGLLVRQSGQTVDE
jgi:hypothetical protein